jgi:molybdopterin-guanine dinucleotide biosynthesis protein B
MASEENGMLPPIVAIVGKSDSGKTTLLEKLIPELKARGYRVGAVKHDIHGFDIDHPGKDSWRMKQAGACTVVISSPEKVALVRDVDFEEPLDTLISRYFSDVDIILTEGYKKENKPKIEVFRPELNEAPLCRAGENFVAIVSSTSQDVDVPHFNLDNIKGVADFLEEAFLK